MLKGYTHLVALPWFIQPKLRDRHTILRPMAMERLLLGNLKSEFGARLLSAQHFVTDCHGSDLEHQPPLTGLQSEGILQICFREICNFKPCE